MASVRTRPALAFLALLLLVPGPARPRSVEAQRPPAQAQKGAPAAAPPQGAEAPAGQAARTGERRRRTSYARCNRISHERNLHGGVRRRFMIRCRLGYEKPRQQQAAPPAPAQPPQNPPAQAVPNAAPPPPAQPVPPPAKRP